MHDFRGIQNAWRCHWSDEIQKKDVFFLGKSCSRDFGTPGCNPCTLIDLANTALASRGPVKTTCMISEGYRTNRGVTGPMNFKKSGRFFRKILLPGFRGSSLPYNTLIDFINTALANKRSLKPICMISEGYRNHGGVTGPMNFKKKDVFFSESRAPGF